MTVWGIERRRVSNLGIQSRKDDGGKIFGSNESVGFDSDVGRKRLSDKKNESVVAAIDLAAIDRYRVYQRLFL